MMLEIDGAPICQPTKVKQGYASQEEAGHPERDLIKHAAHFSGATLPSLTMWNFTAPVRQASLGIRETLTTTVAANSTATCRNF